MGRYGQAILTIGGTIIGAYFGYPGLGAALGSLAGQLLFPTKLPTINGPRLADLQQTSSTVGAPIPRGWGTYPAGGAIIAKTDIREVIESDEVGGKGGGGQTVNTPTYYQDFAISIGDGENPIYGLNAIGGVRAIWANGKAIYDRRPRGADESDASFTSRMAASDILDAQMVVYLGTEDQLPDPTLEAFYGVGQISAFRGNAYIVFHNWKNKAEDGNRMPAAWKFEVFENGSTSGAGSGEEFANEVLYAWRPIGGDPRNPLNDHQYFTNSPGAEIHDNLEDVCEEAAAANGRTGIDPTPIAWRITETGPPNPYMGDGLAHERVTLHLLVNRTIPGDAQGLMPGAGNAGNGFRAVCDTVFVAGYGFGHQWWWVGANFGIEDDRPIDDTGIYTFHQLCGAVASPPVDPEASITANGCTQFGECVGSTPEISLLPDLSVNIKRVPTAPPNPCDDPDAIEIPELPGYCVVGGELVRSAPWVKDESQTYHVLQKYEESAGDVTQYPLGPARPLGHADDNQIFWEAAYAAAVEAGDMEPGLIYGDALGYPVTQAYGYTRATISGQTITTQQANVGRIVRDLCVEGGCADADLDTTDIDGLTVLGAVRTRVMPPRSMLDPLRQALRFDGYEGNGVIRWIRRGGPVRYTFTDDELGYAIAGDDPPSKITTRKQQDADLPRQVRVHYLSPARDYEQGQQASPLRLETEAVNDLDVELPLVMLDDDAAQTAQILWADAWAGRWDHDAAIDYGLQQLTPTDVVVMPVDGVAERMRIVSIAEQFPSVRKLSLARDDVDSWTSYAIATIPPYVPPPLTFAGPIEAILLDVPALRDSDDDAGFYACARPYIAGGFTGGALYRSIDGGATFALIAQFATAATVGRIEADVAAAVPYIFDEAHTIRVKLQSGALESMTHAQIIAGNNAAAIGADGRWEIVQFRDVEQVGENTWALTGLLRGRRGTEHNIGLTLEGDRFVLLTGAGVVRVPLDTARIGQVLKYRAIAVNGNLSGAVTQDFAGNAVALKPFSPVRVRATRDTLDDLTITWIRRSRLGQTLQDGHDIPLNEATELYRIDVQDPADETATIRTLTSTTTTVEYPIDQQAADGLGPTDDVVLTVSQISAIVGAGYPTTITIAPSAGLPVPGSIRSTDLTYLAYAKGPYPGGPALPRLAYRVKFTGYVVDLQENGTGVAYGVKVLPDASATPSGTAGAFDVVDVAHDPADARYFFIAQLYNGEGAGTSAGRILKLDSQAFIPGDVLSHVTVGSAIVAFAGDPEGIVVIGGYVYAACPYEGVIRTYQAVDLTPAGVLNVAIPLWSLMTDGTDLWGLQRVNGAPGIMANIDQTDGSIISSFPVGTMPVDGKIVGGFLYCVCVGDAELQKYELATGIQQGFTFDMSADTFVGLRNYLTLDGTLLSVGRSDIHIIDTTTDTVDP